MAKFNPEIQVDLGQDQTNRSRATMGSLEPFGTLFEGLGKGLTNYVDTQDKLIRQDIARTADREVNNELGNILGLDTPASTKAPREVSNAYSDLARLKTAYDQGKLSDMYFYGKAAGISKSLRNKYPGYAYIVDDAIANSIGTNPANNIRRELLQEMQGDAAEMDKTTKWWMDWAKQNEEFFSAVGEDISTFDFTDTARMRQIQAKVSRYKGISEGINREKALIDQADAKDKQTVQRAKRAASKEISLAVDTLFNVKINPLWEQFTSTLKSDLSDGKISPEEKVQLSQIFGQLELDLGLQIEKKLNGTDPSGFSYSGILTDKTDKDDLRDIAQTQIKLYKDLLVGEDFGLFNAIAMENKARVEGFENELYSGENGPLVSRLMIAAKNGIDMKTLDGIFSDPKVLGPAKWANIKKQAGLQIVGADVLSGVNQNYGDTVKQMIDSGSPKDYLDTSTQQMSDVLAMPQADKKVLSNTARSIYRPGGEDKLLSNFSGGALDITYKRFTRPEITQNLKGSPEYPLYQEWTRKNHNLVAKQAMSAIINNNHLSKYVNIEWDKGKSQWNFSIIPLVTKSIGPRGAVGRFGPDGQQVLDGVGLEQVEVALRQLNDYAARVKDVEENGNVDPNSSLQMLYQSMGVSPDAQGENTILGKMYQSLMSAGESEAEEGKQGSLEGRGITDYARNQESAEGFVPAEGAVSGVRFTETDSPEIWNALSSKLATKGRTEDLAGMDSAFAQNIAALMNDAPPEIAKHLGILSGSRSPERQRVLWEAAVKKYGSPEAARKWVAPPGRSMHGKGIAADFSWDGKFLSEAPPEAIAWLHENADRYNLHFPLNNENWHIEAKGSRRKKVASK